MLFGNEVINTERLTVPHYDMKNRGFMLWPPLRSRRVGVSDGEMLQNRLTYPEYFTTCNLVISIIYICKVKGQKVIDDRRYTALFKIKLFL